MRIYQWFSVFFFFFKQKTAYEMRISDWSSDVCSSDLVMGKVDILVIGNEPYFETREQDRDLDLNAFYETMAGRIIAYRSANCGKIGRASCRERVCQYV